MRKGTISNVAYGFGAAIIRPECATILRSIVSNKNEVSFKMGYCGKCGAKMEDNEWVCGKCGMPRNAAANTYRPVEPIFSDSPNDPTPSRTEKKKKVKPLVGVVAFMIAGLVSYFGVGAVLKSTLDKSASTQVSTESWKPLVDSNDSGGSQNSGSTQTETPTTDTQKHEETQKQETLAAAKTQEEEPDVDIVFVDGEGNQVMTSQDIVDAWTEEGNAGTYSVAIKLTQNGRKKFTAATKIIANSDLPYDKKVIISYLYGKQISIARVDSTIDTQIILISGNRTKEQAEELAKTIKIKKKS